MKSLLLTTILFVSFAWAQSPIQYYAQMANDTYLEKNKFLKKYKNECKELYALKASSVPFYLCKKENHLWLAVFRGSKSISNWISNTNFSETSPLLGGSKVHTGFYNEANKAFDASAAYLKKEDTLISIGHSLGGAVAILYAQLLHQQGISVEVISFGAPPVGNSAFVKSIADIKHWRYFHIKDQVPNLSQETIERFKNDLSLLKSPTKQENNDSLRNRTIKEIQSIKYDYVHLGKGIALDFTCKVPFSTEAGWGIAIANQVFKYHAMPCYLESLIAREQF
jgi:hypothetical protein